MHLKKCHWPYANFVLNPFTAQPRIGLLLRLVTLQMAVNGTVRNLAGHVAPLEQFAALGRGEQSRRLCRMERELRDGRLVRIEVRRRIAGIAQIPHADRALLAAGQQNVLLRGMTGQRGDGVGLFVIVTRQDQRGGGIFGVRAQIEYVDQTDAISGYYLKQIILECFRIHPMQYN